MATAEEKDFFKSVIEDTNKVLSAKKIVIEEQQAPRVIETAAEVFLEKLIAHTAALAEQNGGEASVSFKQLLDVNITNRKSEDGDKDGNITVSFVPGPQAKLLAKKDTVSEGDDD